MPRNDIAVDLRPALLASIAIATARRSHAEVQAGARRMAIALRPYLTGTGHQSAEAAANNLASWMQDPEEDAHRWHGALTSLKAYGLSGETLERAARDACNAWAGVR